MSARQTCRIGISVALLAVSAAVTVPLGPVPFTLQTMVLALLPAALGWRTSACSAALYLLLGAVGLPVFSGLSGGLGHLLGPTGGFLWGFLVGTALGGTLCRAAGHSRLGEALGVVAMLLASYAAGTMQLALVMGLSVPAAASMAVLPFIVPDALKLVAGVSAGRAVRRALSDAPQRVR